MRPNIVGGDNSQNMRGHKGGFIQKLKNDASGNALAIMAACMIPLAAAIGGGVDMSRAYLAKARLNQACDAAALAGRRAMTGEDLSTAIPEAEKFFNFNFPQGTMDTDAFEPEITKPDTGVIRVNAATNVPTSVMKIFGFTEIPISVECDATQNFDNIDVMLVLDTTGSMNCGISDTSCTGSLTETTSSRIVSLRDAVMAFYNELASAQAQLTAQGLRLRYGIVNYSSTVNVGSILPAGSVVGDNWDYQARVANYTDPEYVGTVQATKTTTDQTYGSKITGANCRKYGSNTSFSSFSPSATSAGTAPADTYTYTYAAKTWNGSTTIPTSGSTTATCIRTRTETKTTYETKYKFKDWTYKQVNYDNTAYAAGQSVQLALGTGGTVSTSGSYNAQQLAVAPGATGITTVSSTWPGCIEERETVKTITGSTSVSSIPAGANDLNIDLPATSRATRWAPMRTDFPIYTRSGTTATSGSQLTVSSQQLACPAPARKLSVMTKAQMQTAVNSLTAGGYTYHDIGMIWGARMISSNSVFGSDNPTTFNDRPVSKYIIYMTDGALNPGRDVYSAYGIERMDGRISGTSATDTTLDPIHAKRFQMACFAARSLGAQIWAIHFENKSVVDPTLVSCTGSADRTALVKNGAALTAKFQEIAKNIGTLRLAK